jgi:hypothetical protein
MGKRISESLRSEVTQRWLKGESRFAQKQGGENNGYAPSEMGFKISKDNKDQDQFNPTLTRTVMIRDVEFTIPKS